MKDSILVSTNWIDRLFHQTPVKIVIKVEENKALKDEYVVYTVTELQCGTAFGNRACFKSIEDAMEEFARRAILCIKEYVNEE